MRSMNIVTKISSLLTKTTTSFFKNSYFQENTTQFSSFVRGSLSRHRLQLVSCKVFKMACSTSSAVVEAQNGETGKAEKTSAVEKNKKGQILSNRAKRRMERIKLIKDKVNPKEKKRLKRLTDPNADANAGFSKDIFEDTEYYFENGLRKVYPYYYTFMAFAKRRWVGRKLIDVFADEFRAENKEFYKEAVEIGAMTVNGKIVSPDYKLADSDLVENRIHRHENPVSDKPFEVIYEDEDVLVVDKPSSIPCHPCGRYRFNSAVFILGKEMNQPNLRNIYRLDRLTSGVMLCGKTAKRTAQLEKHILNREVEKEYVCRVVGEFPDGRITVDQPLECLSYRVSVWKVSASGKASKTEFEKISSNGKTSVVKCFPKTGRTHQIRVHLQYLGYPIVNDPIYNSPAFGPLRGKGGDYGQTEAEVIKEIEKRHNVGEWENGDNPLFAEKMALREKMSGGVQGSSGSGSLVDHIGDVVSTVNNTGDVLNTVDNTGDVYMVSKSSSGDTSCDIIESIQLDHDEPMTKRLKVVKNENTGKQPGFDASKWEPDSRCKNCRKNYLDPSPDTLVMYLHALRYKGPDWEYQTELPDWAREDFVENEEG